uniref:Uncharacterized protein n=1 Tax=Arundo donax TaxID=35708 RepID=A0A0A8Z9U9_ARUDO
MSQINHALKMARFNGRGFQPIT